VKSIPSIDISVPNVARMYDYWLGGKNNFEADRQAAERSRRAVPQLPWLCRENRMFLGRAVRFCAHMGVTQFIDIGTGLPTMQSTHEVAASVIPSPRVAYMDNDPVVVRHAQALLAAPGTVAVQGDLAQPEEFLGNEELLRLIDFSQPLALLMTAVLHYMTDEDGPYEGVARLCEAMTPGSYLVISHAEMRPRQAPDEPWGKAVMELSAARVGLPVPPARTREEITAFFGGMTLEEPGLTEVSRWRPDADPVAMPSDVLTLLGGIGRKDVR
jgi:hypothetical protein